MEEGEGLGTRLGERTYKQQVWDCDKMIKVSLQNKRVVPLLDLSRVNFSVAVSQVQMHDIVDLLAMYDIIPFTGCSITAVCERVL